MLIIQDSRVGIDENGFFCNEILDNPIAKTYPEFFGLAYDVNSFMYSLYESFEANNTDKIACYNIGTYSKIHKLYQSSVLLCSIGLEESAKVCIRSMLDKLFVMQAIRNDNEYYNKWIDCQRKEANKLVNAINREEKGLEHLKGIAPASPIYPKAKGISHYDWSVLAGMEKDYNLVYRLFSGNVHSSFSAFEDDFVIEEEQYVALDIGPQIMAIRHILITTIGYALQTLRINMEYFGISSCAYDNLVSCFEKLQNGLLNKLEKE